MMVTLKGAFLDFLQSVDYIAVSNTQGYVAKVQSHANNVQHIVR